MHPRLLRSVDTTPHLAGNTGLPIMLRVIMTILARLRPNSKAIRFVLDNPRRCTVAFFNAKQTAALFLVLLFNLFFQFFFFLGTSINKPEIRELANWDQLVTMGWFQSCSTRAAGMNVFDLRALSKAMAVVRASDERCAFYRPSSPPQLLRARQAVCSAAESALAPCLAFFNAFLPLTPQSSLLSFTPQIYCVMMWISSAPMVSMMEATRQTVVAKYVNGEVILVYEGGDGDDTHPFKKYLNSHLRWLGVIFLLIATAEEKARARRCAAVLRRGVALRWSALLYCTRERGRRKERCVLLCKTPSVRTCADIPAARPVPHSARSCCRRFRP